MSKEKVSTFAPLLISLGFKRISGPPVVEIGSGNRAARRKAKKTMRLDSAKPYFTASDVVTYAKDETGSTWMKMGKVDLTSHGFDDSSQVFEAFLKLRRETDKDLH